MSLGQPRHSRYAKQQQTSVDVNSEVTALAQQALTTANQAQSATFLGEGKVDGDGNALSPTMTLLEAVQSGIEVHDESAYLPVIRRANADFSEHEIGRKRFAHTHVTVQHHFDGLALVNHVAYDLVLLPPMSSTDSTYPVRHMLDNQELHIGKQIHLEGTEKRDGVTYQKWRIISPMLLSAGSSPQITHHYV